MNEIGQVQNDGITLLDLLKAVKKHTITAVITLVAILVAVAAFTFLSTPKYTATSELLATYRSSSGAAGSGTSSVAGELSSGASYINSQIQTYPQLVKTESVLQPVIDDLGLKTTVKELAATVTASNPSDTMLVDISVENVDPKVASTASNNCFGMKKNLSGNNWPGSTWTGKSMTWVSSEASSGETVRQPSEFRVYASVEDSIADHSAYLAGAMNGTDLRYKGLRWQLDYRTAAQIIKDGGYATAPDYVEVLCAMIERYNLTQYNVAQPPFLVRVTVPMVAARKGPGSEYPATVVVRGPNIFTITEVQGSYGRLKSGAGWLNLRYAEWICSE